MCTDERSRRKCGPAFFSFGVMILVIVSVSTTQWLVTGSGGYTGEVGLWKACVKAGTGSSSTCSFQSCSVKANGDTCTKLDTARTFAIFAIIFSVFAFVGHLVHMCENNEYNRGVVTLDFWTGFCCLVAFSAFTGANKSNLSYGFSFVLMIISWLLAWCVAMAGHANKKREQMRLAQAAQPSNAIIVPVPSGMAAQYSVPIQHGTPYQPPLQQQTVYHNPYGHGQQPYVLAQQPGQQPMMVPYGGQPMMYGQGQMMAMQQPVYAQQPQMMMGQGQMQQPMQMQGQQMQGNAPPSYGHVMVGQGGIQAPPSYDDAVSVGGSQGINNGTQQQQASAPYYGGQQGQPEQVEGQTGNWQPSAPPQGKTL